MSTSRRNFLKTGSLMALATGVPVGIAGQVVNAATGSSLSAAEYPLSKADFEAQLNTKFVINSRRSKVPVKLVEVEDLGSMGTKEAFSLLFRGHTVRPLPQDTYVIEHARLGTFSFLLVPVMKNDERGSRYEAVINRLH